MSVVFAEQYGVPACVPQPGESADDLIERCYRDEAIYHDAEDECFVVVLRPDVGPELWTERALRGSLERREEMRRG